MKKAVLFVATLMVFGLAFGGLASAGNFDGAIDSARVGAGLGDADAVSGDASDIDSVITTVVEVLSVIVGVLAVIMIIISGFKYVTSGGDAQKVASAKSTLIYAIIGIVIVVLAQVIVRFVLSSATATP